ncbi:MAG: hypothetical protein KDC95_12660 [Planctomycetes bacterium]|nr:hypothetical protein [Planctomycetota bacterium]
MKYAIGIAVLVLLGGLAWFVFDREAVPAVDLGRTPPSEFDAPSGNEVVADRSGAVDEPEAHRAANPDTASADTRDSRLARIVGRCVDEHGKPLAGCVVHLHGWGANTERMDAYRKDHDAPAWTDPDDVTTGADGRFVIEFVPPPPFQFALDVKADGRVETGGRWSTIAEGERKDVGDVRMDPGALIEGFVRDTNAKPIAKAQIFLRAARASGGFVSIGKHDALRPRNSGYARTGEDGSYAVAGAMSFGAWTVGVREYEVVEPTIELETATTRHSVDIVVRARADVETITGTVVDDLGVPVARASVETVERNGRPGAFRGVTRDGAFSIRRIGAGNSEGPFAIAASSNGFEDARTTEFYEWGARDVRLVMRRGLDVELLVRDATTGKPVEEYGVRVFPKPGTLQRQSSSDFEVRNRGEHAGGLTTLERLPRGTLWLVVEPKGRTWQRNPVHEFVVTDAGAARQTIELTKTVSRIVRVRRSNGDPVEGTRIELVDPLFGAVVDASTKVIRDERYSIQVPSMAQALHVFEATSNAAGEATIEGPGRAQLALGVLGPGHAPIFENGIVLDASDAPIEILVPSGARVTGTIGPKELLEQLREQVGLSSKDDSSSTAYSLRPSVRLARNGDGTRREYYPAKEKIYVDRDGGFSIEGAPTGDWMLELVMARAVGPRTFTSGGEAVARLNELKEGETRTLDLDLSRRVRARVKGLVLVDGEPCSKGSVLLKAKRPDDGLGNSPMLGAQVHTDDESRFEVLLEPGSYRVELMVLDALAKRWAHFPIHTRIVVAPGETQDVTLRVQTGRLRLLLRDSEDHAVSDVRIAAKGPLDDEPTELGRSNTEGAVDVLLPTGSWILLVQHKDYQDPAKLRELQQKHGMRANELMYRNLQSIQVVAGPAKELKIRLPAEAGY